MTTFKTKFQQGTPVFGCTTQHVTQPWLAKIWKSSGYDFVFLEYEHAFFNDEQLAGFVLCCRSEGLPVIAKVPECSRTHVAKLLDCGVIGIQLPWTETREQIDKLVSLVKSPIGIRAAAPGYGNADYDIEVDPVKFLESADRDSIVLAHIETKTGVENIDSILSNPHVDIVFLGMYDLSVSFGLPAQFTHPTILAAVDTVIQSGRRHKKIIGMFAPDSTKAALWLERGITFFETASEVDLISTGGQATVREFRAAAQKKSLGKNG